MVARKLFSLVLFAAASCGLTLQSQAGSAVPNGSFELGEYSDLANVTINPVSLPTVTNPYDITSWSILNNAYQMGFYVEDFRQVYPNGVDGVDFFVHGYDFRSSSTNSSKWIDVDGPSLGDYYALLRTKTKPSGATETPISSITTLGTVKIGANEDVVVDAFLFTENNSENNPANFLLEAGVVVNGQFITTVSRTIGSGNTKGWVIDPWTPVALTIPEAGEYTLRFSVQNVGSGNNVQTYVGLDNVRVVPVPSAAYAGLALLGLFPLRKKLMGR